MNTTNLISTPNIEGNIGSCDSKYIETFRSKGIILNKKNVIVTNSCTGQIVDDYSYTDYSSIIPATLVLLIAIFLIAVAIMHISDE